MKNYALFLCVILVSLPGLSCQPKVVERPNIILINIDDLGWRDFGFMGSQFYETPYIDQLASRGMVFTQGYAAAANCSPSRACIMTGLWTPRHGIYTVASSERGEAHLRKLIPTPNTVSLADSFVILPELLKQAGYLTCHAGKWHLSKEPKDHGFDENIGGGHNGHPQSYYPPYGNVDLEPIGNQDYLTDVIMTRVLEFVRRTETPFFLNYAPYAVHTPIHPVTELVPKYQEKESWQGQHNPAYASMIENLDRNIGRLVMLLDEMKLTTKTFIVLTSDNGGLYGITYQRPLRAGKGSYYEGGIRVPYCFFYSDVIESAIDSTTPITHLDLLPTILDAASINFRNEEYDGNSLWPLLSNTPGFDRERALFWHFPIYLQAYDITNNETRDSLFRTRPGSVVRQGNWKLHQYFEDAGIELYNLGEDPGESQNVAGDFPDKTEELSDLLEIWRGRTNAPVPKDLNPKYSNRN